MAHYQNIYNGGNGAPPVAQAAPRMTDWSGEVTPLSLIHILPNAGPADRLARTFHPQDMRRDCSRCQRQPPGPVKGGGSR